jgi:hypothetical protein
MKGINLISGEGVKTKMDFRKWPAGYSAFVESHQFAGKDPFLIYLKHVLWLWFLLCICRLEVIIILIFKLSVVGHFVVTTVHNPKKGFPYL